MSSEPVSTFSFRAEFESGRSLEFVPKYVHPLGIGEINLIASQATSALELKFDTIDAVVDGSIEPGHATVTGKFTFHEPATVYALVPGGWLPLQRQFISTRSIRRRICHDAGLNIGWRRINALRFRHQNPRPSAPSELQSDRSLGQSATVGVRSGCSA